MIPRPPPSPLFPYTTLFRSALGIADPGEAADLTAHDDLAAIFGVHAGEDFHQRRLAGAVLADRSEEHTSELQSQSNLVCRLLLEKKKNKITTNAPAITTRR